MPVVKQKKKLIPLVKKELKRETRLVSNAPVKAYEHLIGERFSTAHKAIVGIVFMIVGVAIAKAGAEVSYHIVGFVFDGIGYMVHGAGCTPFLEYLHNKLLKEESKRKEREENKVN